MRKKVLVLSSILLMASLIYGFKVSKFTSETVNSFKGIDSKQIPPIKETKKEPEKYFSPYTGEEITKDALSNIPFMAIVENSKASRPQTGLAEADIIYETMAEGGISRFIALFHKDSPKSIGPIRSARPYFINISKEYNLPFAHCGASAEAENYIITENLMSLNEFNYGAYYWRDENRISPHNLYTSAEKIRRLINKKEFVKKASSNIKFDKSYWDSESLTTANNLSLKFNKYYSTNYSINYSSIDKKYNKIMDNVKVVDGNSKEELLVANIVIQITDIKLQADGSHMDINLVGEGNGYIISNGKAKEIIWSRKDLNSHTELKSKEGISIPLSPGRTWWHVTDKNTVIELK